MAGWAITIFTAFLDLTFMVIAFRTAITNERVTFMIFSTVFALLTVTVYTALIRFAFVVFTVLTVFFTAG